MSRATSTSQAAAGIGTTQPSLPQVPARLQVGREAGQAALLAGQVGAAGRRHAVDLQHRGECSMRPVQPAIAVGRAGA